jgi:hypothetical protein
LHFFIELPIVVVVLGATDVVVLGTTDVVVLETTDVVTE